ncbi:glycosyltransferase family 2 protein [Leuconostoc lactis]|uniref:glycosyltransferase family 2 protein n=1 Tax=Leuconostoc lactis TaxID=1246 RepID=UPI0025B1A4B5|nr:glycosyltransferase family 2 protein [Leuconostoc lactis]MDN2649367.1 glycosyltransferase family 2 protein [Leuconostoc lactis]
MIAISVIVPIYNVQDSLATAIDSLLNQDLNLIEIILIDDGSTDKSSIIAKKYQNKYPDKISYYRKVNGGLSSARNYGLQFAKGEFVTFLDSDDYVEHDLYKKMYDVREENTKIIECDFIWEYPNKNQVDIKRSYKSVRDYMLNGRVVAWNKLYKRLWLKEIKILFKEGILYEDLNFFFKILTQVQDISEVKIVNEIFVHYVQHEGTITSTYSKKILDVLKSYEDVFEYYESLNLLNQYKDELEYKFVRNLFGSFLLKTLHIPNYQIRKSILHEFWYTVEDQFPFWKKNPYLKKVQAKNLYLKSMNLRTINFLGCLHI